MSQAIPDLWPDDLVNTDILTPLAILRIQAGQLREKTKGLLEAAIESIPDNFGSIKNHFDIVVPALDRYRYRLLTVSHAGDKVYPARVESDNFPLDSSGDQTGYQNAHTQDEFIDVLRDIFQSPATRSLFQSIIAQSNDRQQAG